jgi:hypothetical protein
VILGARTVEQLDDNLGAAALHLTAEETARLDEVSDPGTADYPYGDVGTEQRSGACGGTEHALSRAIASSRHADEPDERHSRRSCPTDVRLVGRPVGHP